MSADARSEALALALRSRLAASNGHGRRKAATLFGHFGVRRLTAGAREEVSQALEDAGIVVDPPLAAVDRERFVSLRVADPPAGVEESHGAHALTIYPDVRGLPDLVETMSPAVVHITTDDGQGSGFAVDHEGFVLTNAHVVRECKTPGVKLSGGLRTEANVVGVDASTDLAVLRVPANGIPALEFKPLRAVRVGEPVVAVGSPVGLEWSVTLGIVSGLDRTMPAPDGRQIQYMIQTDADVNPGNSGGPLLALDGQVVGVNASGLVGHDLSGLNFAIPSDTAAQVYAEIRECGSVRRAALGARAALVPFFGDEADKWGQDGGAVLTDVRAGGPANEAGLRAQDIVIGLDDELVDEPGDIFRLLNRERIGRECEVRFIRDGELQVTTATPIAR